MKTIKTSELISHMLTELDSPYKPLSPWEQSFVESVSDQFYVKGDLSDKQFETLEKIYTAKTA